MDRYLSDEREVNHFGFCSTFLMSDLRTSIIYSVNSIHKDIADCIIRKQTLSGEAEQTIHGELENLSNLCQTKLDESFKKHKESIRELFVIPENLTFTSDELTNESSDVLHEEIKHLQKQYENDKKLLCVYKQEMKNYEGTIDLQERVSRCFEELKTCRLNANSTTGIIKDYEDLIGDIVTNNKAKHAFHKNRYNKVERVLLPNLNNK